MKAAILTSSMGGYVLENEVKVASPMVNANGFVSKLKALMPTIGGFVFLASSPDSYEITDAYAALRKKSFELSGFEIKGFTVVDSRFKGDLALLIKNADVVFLAGGHVPTQNAYFKQIMLKEKLKDFKGVLIGQSAGSMNCADFVYVQPEYEEETADKNFNRLISGLGLTKVKIMPHINTAKDYLLGGVTPFEMSLADSYKYPHFGIADGAYIEIAKGKTTFYGETYYFKRGKAEKFCGDSESRALEEKGL